MKKVDPTPKEELRPEYRLKDLGNGVRGKHYEAYAKGAREDLQKNRESKDSK